MLKIGMEQRKGRTSSTSGPTTVNPLRPLLRNNFLDTWLTPYKQSLSRFCLSSSFLDRTVLFVLLHAPKLPTIECKLCEEFFHLEISRIYPIQKKWTMLRLSATRIKIHPNHQNKIPYQKYHQRR
ncbi:hypothetical protein L1887_01984 [Cichorium endivia]|nr:hypothetical protein L1887_01984 [Cichorium endivia]